MTTRRHTPHPAIPEPMPVTHVLARHGRTVLNAQGRLRGRLDPPLDELGRAQAARLAELLVPLVAGWRHPIVSSPLARTIQTAQAIAARTGLTVTIDERLIDRDYGQWAGHLRDEVLGRWGSLDAAPGVEAHAQLDARVRSILDESVEWEPVVLVTHDAVLHVLLGHLDPRLTDTQIDPGSWSSLGRTATGELVVTSTNQR